MLSVLSVITDKNVLHKIIWLPLVRAFYWQFL